ncbi:MAG TPA: T9SS type A sorting domain-containing protein, partial [Anseongella sp.]|nr:T9SS type A sorting domain-containing protein [Anseongella sp.]
TYGTNSQTGTIRAPLIITAENEAGRIVTYPNPFGQQANIRIDLKGPDKPGGRRLKLSVYDVSGNLVFEGREERVSAGSWQTSWNGRNRQGTDCLAGVYFINVTIDGIPLSQKVIKVDSYK